MGHLGRGRPRKRVKMNLTQKLKYLFEVLRDYKDNKGRQLSLIFLRLPNAREFQDYYEVIKNPIDFEMISVKMRNNVYESLEDSLSNIFIL